MADHGRRRARAQYTSRACDECRRRKVKCSGSDPCQGCLAAQSTCQFNQEGQRGRRRVLEPQNRGQNNISRIAQSGGSTMIHRISSLEEELSRRRGEAALASLQQNAQQQMPQSSLKSQHSREPQIPVSTESNRSSEAGPRVVSSEENWFGQGSALLATQKRVLETLSTENSPNNEMDQSNAESSASIQGNDDHGSTVFVSIQCSLANTPRLAPLIRLFLTEQNICFHCVDPDPFVARLSHLLETYSCDGQVHIPSDKPELISLAALACMVLAHAEFLSMGFPILDQEIAPNAHHLWSVEGRRLLELYPKQAPVNIDIVRFHLVATYYGTGQDCIAQETTNGAYQAIAMAVTSAYSIALNNETKWVNLSEEEKTSRRCLWASIYLMDRQVAYKSGRPYLIQESEVAVSDLTNDIKNLAPITIKENTTNDRKGDGEAAKCRPLNNCPSSTAAPTSSLVPVSPRLKLQYLQGLIEITHVFTRAWRSFFSVRAPVGCEREEVQSLDALFLRVQRNLPVDLSWNTSQFLNAQKTNDLKSVFRLRLLLFTRINLLRLAIHHASIRGRRGKLPLAERYSVAEYQYTLEVCDDVSCATLTALFAYLDHCAPGSCLTTYATSAVIECIYHPVAIAQLSVADGMSNSCRLSDRMIATMAQAVQTFRKAAYSSLNPKTQLPKSVLPLLEGILSQQKHSKHPVAPAGPVPTSLTASVVLPSLKDQINGSLSENALGMQNDTLLQDHVASRNLPVDINAAYYFDPSLLPAPFSDNARAYDFIGDDFFSSAYDIELEHSSL